MQQRCAECMFRCCQFFRCRSSGVYSMTKNLWRCTNFVSPHFHEGGIETVHHDAVCPHPLHQSAMK